MATYHVARADGGGARWDVDAPDAEAAIQQVHACFRQEADIAAAFDPGSERAEMLVPPLIARRVDRPTVHLALHMVCYPEDGQPGDPIEWSEYDGERVGVEVGGAAAADLVLSEPDEHGARYWQIDRPVGALAALAGHRWQDGSNPHAFGGGLVWAEAAILPDIRRA